MRPFLITLLLCLTISVIRGQNDRAGKDYALFFANADYSANSDFQDLKNPVSDAEAIARELEEMYSFQVEIYPDYDRTQIFAILQRWQQRHFKPNDQLFLFFSGHGTFWEFTKKGYFVPKSEVSDYSAYLELTDLGNIITQINCEHILLAVDACYSGTIDQEIAFKGDGFSRPGANSETEKDQLIETLLRNNTRLLITSGGKERTPDGTERSPFAEAVLSGLKAAYVFNDGLFTYTDLLGKLERVSPTPHYGELPGHDQGSFVFLANHKPEEVPPPVKVEEVPDSPNTSFRPLKPEYTSPFDNTTEALFQEILNAIGVPANFEIKAANVSNAMSTVMNGRRYVLYSPEFMERTFNQTGTYWPQAAILAHEIGHHLLGHTMDGSGTSQLYELEADQFSGFVLYRMGATLEQAQWAVKENTPEEGTSTFPPRVARLEAIATGYRNAEEQAGGIQPKPKRP